MRIAGIDLAAQPQNTALCVIDGRRAVITPHPGAKALRADDETLVAATATCERIGIDAPFGWPKPFAEAVVAHRAGRPWPGRDRDQEAFRRSLRLRATDDYVCRMGLGVTPLSVSTDRIGVAAFRCALLLDLLAETDRAGGGRACEVYPAAALRRWYGDQAKGYKRDANKRASLLARLREDTGLLVDDEPFAKGDHAFDAVVCALVAVAVDRDETVPPDAEPLAAEEGWIHVPRKGVPPPRL